MADICEGQAWKSATPLSEDRGCCRMLDLWLNGAPLC